MRPLFSLAALHDSAAEIMFLGDRPAQHHAQPLHPAPPAGCFPCVVNKGACDAVFHERSEERSALHHVLVQARWRGSGDSLRAVLGREDFQFLRTRLAVRCGHQALSGPFSSYTKSDNFRSTYDLGGGRRPEATPPDGDARTRHAALRSWW